jgi:uncharacterized protein YndB with AHSA1/START domain
MSDDAAHPRTIELSIEVAGTPEEVWQAIATGPGISSWFVPHTVEEREGGATTESFGPGPEMQVQGRVAAWEPPKRIVFDGGEGAGGLAFEWLVEARDQSTCIVRLVNSGFGEGEPWDSQFDAMTEGWKLFLRNLQLHRAHFPGQPATSVLPMAMWTGTTDEIWQRLLSALTIFQPLRVGKRLRAIAADGPELAGTVVAIDSHALALVLDEPCAGTAFLVVEGQGVSVWSYLYGPNREQIAARDLPRWQDWLNIHANP